MRPRREGSVTGALMGRLQLWALDSERLRTRFRVVPLRAEEAGIFIYLPTLVWH